MLNPAFATSRAAAAEMPRRSAAGRLFSEFLAGIRDGHEIAGRYDRLSRLSNTELARLGLTRENFARAAVTGTTERFLPLPD
jgi:hypothetical protein